VGLSITAARRGVFAERGRQVRDLISSIESAVPDLNLGDWNEVERFSRRLPVGTATSLAIQDLNGQVNVTGAKQDFIEIEAIRYGRGADVNRELLFQEGHELPPQDQRVPVPPIDERLRAPAGGARLASPLRLEVSRDGGVLSARIVGSRRWLNRARIDLVITAPADLGLSIKTASGSVRTRDMANAVDIATASGDIGVAGAGAAKIASASGDVELRRISGSVEGRVISGGLTMDDIGDNVNVTTVSGDIEARNLRGAISASTVSGSLVVNGYAGSDATLGSTSGHIEVAFTSPLAGHCSARTVSGDIGVGIPRNSDCAIELTSTSGDLDVNLPLSDQSHSRGRLSGTLGAGRGRLDLHSISGDLRVRPSAAQAPPAAAVKPEPPTRVPPSAPKEGESPSEWAPVVP
jgi:DUF4097 and DUF4098 domain-containing protein YvlB